MVLKKPSISPSKRVTSSLLKDLADSAARLNSSSDELGKAIRPIDAALKKLNLGVTAWHRYSGSSGPDQDGDYDSRSIGYAKVNGKWGLALSTVSGNVNFGEEFVEEWLFNDAPRSMRLEALDRIPDLLVKLVEEANQTAERLQKGAETARELAETISALSATTEVQR